MQFSDNTIKEFKTAVQEEYDFSVDSKTAHEILSGLVNFFDLLSKIEYRRSGGKS